MAKARVIKCVSSQGHGDGGLRDIGGIHEDLIATVQEVQTRKVFTS